MARSSTECYMRCIEKIEGGCLCGAVRFTATGQPRSVFWCHCQSCRRHSGAYIVTKGKITKFTSSPGTMRGFCSTCGSTPICEVEALPTETHLHIGALDIPERLQPTRHFFRKELLPWLHLDDKRT